MTRQIYGADGSAQVVSMTGVPTVASATVMSARTGGVTVTDILNMSGANVGGVVTPDSRGQIIFQGPDNTTDTFWLDFSDGGPRWAVRPVDLPGLVSSAMAARELSQYTTPSGTTAKAGIPYVSNHISQKIAAQLDPLVVPRVANQAARDALFPSPTDGDRVYRQDVHAYQTWRLSRWVADPGMIMEAYMTAADASVVTFSSIPNIYRNLKIVYRTRAVGSAAYDVHTSRIGIRFNGDTGSNYASFGAIRQVAHSAGTPYYEVNRAGQQGSTTATTAANYGGTASTTPSSSAGPMGGLTNYQTTGMSTSHVGICPGSDQPISGSGEITIVDYAASGYRKAIYGRSGFMDNQGATTTRTSAYANLQGGWSSNSAITSVELFIISASGFAAGSYFALYGES